ncbi:hypothetical protein SBRY_60002 [Actinacidiphila bryophytorum]|uniref:Uncharacterized protein n=1 Tax=Actinacidiphila bryophytorum TaxID=1436133 RepID=A0A9W4H5K0_9ACTN|nr:hypothetical protein SBRY_60002 [Actinacidiphila bryophytorum]
MGTCPLGPTVASGVMTPHATDRLPEGALQTDRAWPFKSCGAGRTELRRPWRRDASVPIRIQPVRQLVLIWMRR